MSMRIGNSQFNKPKLGFQGAVKVREQDVKQAREIIHSAIFRATFDVSGSVSSRSLESYGCKVHPGSSHTGTTFDLTGTQYEKEAVDALTGNKIKHEYLPGIPSLERLENFIRKPFGKVPKKEKAPTPQSFRTREQIDEEDKRWVREAARPDGTFIYLA